MATIAPRSPARAKRSSRPAAPTDAAQRAAARARLVERLRTIRQRIVASGEKLLTMDEILAEIERNRGGSPWRGA